MYIYIYTQRLLCCTHKEAVAIMKEVAFLPREKKSCAGHQKASAATPFVDVFEENGSREKTSFGLAL